VSPLAPLAVTYLPSEITQRLGRTFLETSQEVLGYRKNGRKEWISQDMWQLIEEGKAAKQRMLTGSP